MPSPQEFPFRLQPLSHQLAEFCANAETPYRAIFWDQGTGKSKLTIDTAYQLYRNRYIDAVVVVAPNGVHRNWASDEIPKHCPEAALPLTRTAFYQSPKADTKWHQRQMDELLKHKGISWLMMSYDGVMTEKGNAFLSKFLRQRRCLFILDEAHNVKGAGAKRTIRLVSKGVYAPFRRILTGTPVAQGPFDIYSQMKFLDKDFWKRHGFDSFQVYKKHFGVWFTAAECQDLHGYDPGFDKLLGYKNLDQLNEILAPYSTRVLKDDVLDLPPKLYTKRYFELTPEQIRLYEALKEEFYVEAMGGVVEAPLAIVRLMRFQQILCGYVPVEVFDEDGASEKLLCDLESGNPRLELFKETAQDISQKTIVWAKHTRDIDKLVELLRGMGGNVVRYDGTCSDDEAADASEQFKTGNAQWIVANPQKGKEGLTWNMAHEVVYYNNSFKLLERLQSEDRAHRIGLKHSVRYTDFVGQYSRGEKVFETVDHHIVKNLRNKFDIASQINGDTLREWI